MRPEPLTVWRHQNTGNDYVVVRLVRLELPDTSWVDGVEYTSLGSGGQSFVRTTERFIERFVPISAARPG